MLILITGISTSGKSTIAKELVKRGHEAYDTEHNGISAWYDKETGRRDAEFGEMPERTKTWLDRHEWRISMDWVVGIAKQATNKPIFLCGGGANEADIRPLCEKVIWLKTDEVTIRERVNIPQDHTYGTQPHELDRIFEGNKRSEAAYVSFGASIVDARKPLEDVIEQILKIAL